MTKDAPKKRRATGAMYVVTTKQTCLVHGRNAKHAAKRAVEILASSGFLDSEVTNIVPFEDCR